MWEYDVARGGYVEGFTIQGREELRNWVFSPAVGLQASKQQLRKPEFIGRLIVRIYLIIYLFNAFFGKWISHPARSNEFCWIIIQTNFICIMVKKYTDELKQKPAKSTLQTPNFSFLICKRPKS